MFHNKSKVNLYNETIKIRNEEVRPMQYVSFTEAEQIGTSASGKRDSSIY